MTVNAQLNRDNTSSVVQTTDGSTSTTIYNQAAFSAVGGGQIVTFDVCGFDFDNAEVATAKIAVKLKNVAGTVSMVGTPVHIVPINAGSSSGLTSASVNIVISGSNIKVNVIGVTGRTIDWTANRVSTLSVLDPWTAVSAPEDGYIQTWDAGSGRWNFESTDSAITLGGDLSGTPSAAVVGAVTGAAGVVYLGQTSPGGTGALLVREPCGNVQIGQVAQADAGQNGAPMYIFSQKGGSGGGVGGLLALIPGGDGGLSPDGEVLISAVSGSISTNEGDGYMHIDNASGVGLNLSAGSANAWITSDGNILLSAPSGGASVNVSANTSTITGATAVTLSCTNGVTINGQLLLTNTSTTTSASAGSNGDVPNQVAGYLRVYLEGNLRLIPYYLP